MTSKFGDETDPSESVGSDDQADARRTALRQSGNPYAAHYYSADGDGDDANAARTAREKYRRSELPYAWHHYIDSEGTESDSDSGCSVATQPSPVRPGISKADFDAGCRTIFRAYIPALENGRLRAHHQEFIRRNRARSPEARFAILAKLRVYDLSSEPGLRTHFNREQDAFTEEKLLRIEKSVTDG
jgi:hypothetical protein